jgi:hypothetical protein
MPVMGRFDVTPGKLFLAALALGMLLPVRMAFAQG